MSGAPAARSIAHAPSCPALRPAVFLDKDGTLVEDVPFNVDPAKLRFTPHALPALQSLQAAGYALVVVSNQSGVALGRFTAHALHELEQALRERLLREGGVRLDGFYCCPHAPEAGCGCRKPAPGLLHRAAAALQLDLGRSWMVGDILDDIEAGQRAGCRGVLLDVGHETLWQLTPLRRPAHRCRDLAGAAQHILRAGGGNGLAEAALSAAGKDVCATADAATGVAA